MRTKIFLVAVAGVALVVSAPAFATTSVRADRPDLEQVARQLGRGQQLRIEGVPLGDGGGPWSTLTLEQFSPFTDSTRIVVHTATGDQLSPVPLNVYYKGRVEGRPASRVFLVARESGVVYGVVSDGARYWLLGERYIPDQSSRGLAGREVDPVSEIDFKAQGFECLTDNLALADATAAPAARKAVTIPTKIAASYTARIAVETDNEFYLKFGSTSAATDYVSDLIAFGSALYDDEVNTTWVLEHLSLWPPGNPDPWNEQSPDCGLYEYGRYWNDNNSGIDRTITAFMSGKSTNAGIAWVGVLCSGQFLVDLDPDDGGPIPRACPSLTPEVDNYGGAYSYIGGMDGNFDIDNPTIVWDIMAVTHEIGHNFNSPHTHCYANIGGNANPVDQCYSGQCGSTGCWCGAQSLPGCSAGGGCGTIMSYCHLLGGGLGNVSLTLGLGHPYGVQPERVPTRMNLHVVSRASFNPGCLDLIEVDTIFSDGFESGGWCSWSAPSCP